MKKERGYNGMVSEKRVEAYLNLWAMSEYGVPCFLVVRERGRRAFAEFERLHSILCDYERIIKELESVVLDMDKCIETVYLNCDTLSQVACEAFRENKTKHKDIIKQLKRNIYLEVKSEHGVTL